MSRSKNRIVLPLLAASAAAVLTVLAVLQYRWTSDLSDAQEAQVGAHLESLMLDWHLDFYHEFTGIADALQAVQPPQGETNWKPCLQRYEEWEKASAHPSLISDVLVWKTSHAKPALLRLKRDSGKAEKFEAHGALEPLLERLRQNSSNLDAALQAWQLPGSRPQEKQPRDSSSAVTGWQFDQNVPALIHPIRSSPRRRNVGGIPADDAVDWLLVVLDMNTIRGRIVPELGRRYFGTARGSEYNVVFRSEHITSGTIYYSEAQGQNRSDVEAVMNIFGPVPESTEGHFWQAARIAASPSSIEARRFTSPVWFPVIRYSALDADWNLALERRSGSLNSVLAAVRRRNLAIGFGVLLLLALSMALVFIASQQAQKLAQLQMEFVASVSHDLRTPLAVIRSASENMAAGVVADKQQLATYATVIRNQTLQLTNLVERVLLFASTRKGTNQFWPRPIAPSDVIASAIRNTSELMESEGIQIQEDLEPDLPNIIGDLEGLSRAMQNLLINAVKHGGEGRWIGIQGRTQKNAMGKMEEVQITVQDRGRGIIDAELKRIFEPFYRSPSAIKARIQGTGLGLAIARNVVEAMGGRLSVRSALGQGSSFTLHLPAAGDHDPKQAFSISERVEPRQ